MARSHSSGTKPPAIWWNSDKRQKASKKKKKKVVQWQFLGVIDKTYPSMYLVRVHREAPWQVGV
jgi:hypothetical protein